MWLLPLGSEVKSDIWEPVFIPGGLSLRLAVGGRTSLQASLSRD